MLLLAPLAVYLPRTALAGVLLVTACGMVDRREMRASCAPAGATARSCWPPLLATLLLPLEFAVLAGMLVVVRALPDQDLDAGRVRRWCRTRTSATSSRAERADGVPPAGRDGDRGLAVLRRRPPRGGGHPRQPGRRTPRQMFLLLRMHMVDHCDVSGIHMLESVVRRYRQRGGDVYLEGVRPRVLHMIGLYGFDRVLGIENLLDTEQRHQPPVPQGAASRASASTSARSGSSASARPCPRTDHAANLPDIAETARPHDRGTVAQRGALPDARTRRAPVMLIDVGEPSEFRNWHIEEVVNIPLRHLKADGARPAAGRVPRLRQPHRPPQRPGRRTSCRTWATRGSSTCAAACWPGRRRGSPSPWSDRARPTSDKPVVATQICVVRLQAAGADAVAELHIGMVGEVGLEPVQ